MTFLDQLQSLFITAGAIILIVAAFGVFLAVWIGRGKSDVNGEKERDAGRGVYLCRDCWNCDGSTLESDHFCPHCGAINPWGSAHQQGLTYDESPSSSQLSTPKPSTPN